MSRDEVLLVVRRWSLAKKRDRVREAEAPGDQERDECLQELERRSRDQQVTVQHSMSGKSCRSHSERGRETQLGCSNSFTFIPFHHDRLQKQGREGVESWYRREGYSPPDARMTVGS